MASTRFIAHIMAAAAWLILCAMAVRAQAVAIPGFWDPNMQMERPQLAGQGTIRVLSDDSFPPLNFSGIDRVPTGFSIELARAACEKLQITCTIQSRRFDALLEALESRQGDMVVAALPITADLRQSFAVTSPYFKNPARFAVQRGFANPIPSPQALKGKAVGAIADTVHEAYLRRFFPDIEFVPFPSLTRATEALKQGRIDYLFADGLNLALWLGGTDSDGCCVFTGGPFLENQYFGEGIGFLFRSEDTALRRAFDYALFQLWKEGKYAELYLRFFPVSPY